MDDVAGKLFDLLASRLTRRYEVTARGVDDRGPFMRVGSAVEFRVAQAYGEQSELVAYEVTAGVGDHWYGRFESATVSAPTEAGWVAAAAEELQAAVAALIEEFDESPDDDVPNAADPRSLAMIDGVRQEYATPLFAQ